MEKQYDKLEFLVYMRRKQNLTQKDLAQILGYSDKTISKWENGDSFPTDEETLKKWAIALNISVDELITGKIDRKYENLRLIKQNYRDQIKKQKMKFVIFIVLLMITLIVIFLMYYHFAIRDTIKYYRVYAVSKNFEIYNSTLFISPKRNVLVISNIENKTEYDIKSIKLLYEEKEVYISGDSNIYIEENLCSNEYHLNDFVNNKFNLIINYGDKYEILNFSTEEIFSNNLFYKKVKKESVLDISKTIEKEHNNFLEKENFNKNEIGIYEKNIDNDVSLNIDLTTNMITLNIYNRKDHKAYDEYIYIKDTTNIIFSSFYHQKKIYENSIDINNIEAKSCQYKCDSLEDYIEYIIYISENL